MQEKLLPFLKAVSAVNTGVFKREVLIRHALALAVSDLSPLPTTPVENLESTFNNTARLPAEDKLAQINEILPLNLNATSLLARAYWIARYKAAFGVARIFEGTDYLDTISGLASAIPADDLEILNQSTGDFSFLYEVCRTTIHNLNTDN